MFFTKVIGEDGVSYNLTLAGYIALAACLVIIFMAGCIIRDKNGRYNAKKIVISAMSVAMAMVTSMITILKMPMGGEVTLLSMLFIVLVGYWFGVRTGITTAVAYGILQLLINPYIISIPQMFLDYIFAFGALGLSGLFSESKNGLVKGYIAGVAGRFFFSFLSGWIFFAVYTPEFFNSAFLYSLVYNMTYIGLEAVITLIIISLPPVKKALVRVKNINQE